MLCFGVGHPACRGVTLIRELVSNGMEHHYKLGHGYAMPDTLAWCERENKKPRIERGNKKPRIERGLVGGVDYCQSRPVSRSKAYTVSQYIERQIKSSRP